MARPQDAVFDEDATRRTALRLLVASSRPAVVAFFESLRVCESEVRVVRVPLDELTALGGETAAAAAAVIDLGPDPRSAVAACEQIRLRRPGLPITGIVCCAHAVSPWVLRRLLADGVSLLDLEAGAEEASRALGAVAAGGSVLQLRLRRGQRDVLREVLTEQEPRREAASEVLRLVASEATDREIGRQLHLSPHTVKHHIEQLRREIGVRNRTQLAAWAGSAGFYQPATEHAGRAPLQLAVARRTRGR